MAASKKVARFRGWLNIPFRYFKVSLVVWKLKWIDSPHPVVFLDISTVRSYPLPFHSCKTTCSQDFLCQGFGSKGLPAADPGTLAEVLLVGSGSQHVVFGCLKWGQWGMARDRALFAHLLWPGNHTWVDCPTLPVSISSFARSKLVMLVDSVNWEYLGYSIVRCRLGFSNLLKRTKTSFGYITWPKDLGSIPETFFEGQGYWQSTWLRLSLLLQQFPEFGSTYQVCSNLTSHFKRLRKDFFFLYRWEFLFGSGICNVTVAVFAIRSWLRL